MKKTYYFTVIFLLGTITLSPIFVIAQPPAYYILKYQQIAIESHFIRRAAISHSQREEPFYGSLPKDIQASLQDDDELHYLLDLTDQADKIIDDICGGRQSFHYKCFPMLNVIWLSDIEHIIIEWAYSSYNTRQKIGEPADINTADLFENFQKLVDITREKDQMIKEWYKENTSFLPRLQ